VTAEPSYPFWCKVAVEAVAYLVGSRARIMPASAQYLRAYVMSADILGLTSFVRKRKETGLLGRPPLGSEVES
jgi:hypothetical protein